MRLKIKNIRDVAEYQLCCGCGACAYISPTEIRMVDTLEFGRRPLLPEGGPQDPRSEEALCACPGMKLEHTFDPHDVGLIAELTAGWGPVREVWEGYAADPEIRFAGSSGGAASALAFYCIEQAGMHGVLHIAARQDVPYLNETVLSRTRADLLARTGSRYAPASPCDGLQMIEDAPGPCVFIGKPCDVAGALMAANLRPKLAEKLGLTIAIFCAGTPTTRATLALLRQMGVDDPTLVQSICYRGNGWPGRCTVVFCAADRTTCELSLSYEESWGVLTNDKQWRCHLCPDHSGEFADLAVGDAWHRKPQSGEAGRSLVLARTERGRRLLATAGAAGALRLEPAAPTVLSAAQPGLLKARGAIWGRLLALRAMGIPVPQYVGLPMLRSWLTSLSLSQKLRSFLGALRRVFRKRLHRRVPVVPFEPRAARPASWHTARHPQPEPATH